MASFIGIVSASGQPLTPTTRTGRVRHLLKNGQARIISHQPFAIQLLYETPEIAAASLTLGGDPGSLHFPLALAQPDLRNPAKARIVYAHEILLRTDISSQLKKRADARGSRRHRQTRYRPPRFQNRVQSVCSACGVNHPPKVWKTVKRKHGHSKKVPSNGRAALCRQCQQQVPRPTGQHSDAVVLNPTLQNKVDTVLRTIQHLCTIFPIGTIRMELTAFDTQKMANPAIQDLEYQHGTLSGYEIKEYLLRRDQHRCVYCHGKSGDPILEIEHVISQAHGGSNRISNLVIACHACNHEKGPRDAITFGFPAIQRMADKFRAFRYSALTQSYKWALWHALQDLQVPLEATFGYVTKYWRHQHHLPKVQVMDAMVIAAGDKLFALPDTMIIERRLKARRPFHHWSHENQKGQAIVKTPARRLIQGFGLYDRVLVTSGSHCGTIAYITGLRASGAFQLSTLEGTILGNKQATRLQRLQPVWRNCWIETRSVLQAILKEFRPAPTAMAVIAQAFSHS